MVVNIANYIAAAGGVAALLSLVWIARRPDQDRAEEDEARAFFDLHGHWPDEPPEAAAPLGPGPRA